jgi:hypothetical protein
MARFRFQAEIDESAFLGIDDNLKDAKYRSVFTMQAIREKLARMEGYDVKARRARIARDAELLRPVLESLGLLAKS